MVWWALRKAGVEEWLIGAVMAFYARAETVVKIADGITDYFKVLVGYIGDQCLNHSCYSNKSYKQRNKTSFAMGIIVS